MKKKINSFLRIWFPAAAFIIALTLPNIGFAQDPAATSASAGSETNGLGSTLNLMNILLVVIGLEIAFIALLLSIRNPETFGLGSMIGSITGSTASEQEMDHAYDGITEIDNPVPSWLKMIFIFTIAWAFVYIIYYHFSASGYSQIDEYNAEMAMYQKEKPVVATLKLEDLKVQVDPAVIAAGKKVFNSICYSCHGKEGQGDSGPNLTDENWLHGGTISQIYTVISEGVQGKNMLSFKGQFTDKERLAVASYILSLKGSNPINQRKPEGTLFSGDPNSMPGSKPAVTDSIKTDSIK